MDIEFKEGEGDNSGIRKESALVLANNNYTSILNYQSSHL